MQSDDATEPVDVQELRRCLTEWAAIASHMIDLLHESVDCQRSLNWRPHLTQIVDAIRAFGERCRTEAVAFSSWGADGAEADDVLQGTREQGERLVEWLHRMMAE